MNPTYNRASAMLASLGAASSQADATEKNIKGGAEKRLQTVTGRLEELRPTVLTSAADAEEYQGLVIERHRLNQVVMAS